MNTLSTARHLLISQRPNLANNFCFVLTLVTTSNHPNQTIGVSELSATMKTNTKTSANHDNDQYKTLSKMSMV